MTIAKQTLEEQAVQIFLDREDRGETYTGPCGCMGRRDGEQGCPCEMKTDFVKLNHAFFRISRTRTIDGYKYTAENVGSGPFA